MTHRALSGGIANGDLVKTGHAEDRCSARGNCSAEGDADRRGGGSWPTSADGSAIGGSSCCCGARASRPASTGSIGSTARMEEGQQTVLRGLLKRSFHAAAGIWGGVRFSMIDLMNCRAAASFLRFIATAVRRAWIFMFSSPLRMALASPWSVLAVPCAPSTRQRWRVWIACSSSPMSRVCAGRAGWPHGWLRYAPGEMWRPGAGIAP